LIINGALDRVARPSKPACRPPTNHQEVTMTKEEILEQLNKNGVTNLDELADLLVREAHEGGDPNKPIANGVIIYNHGFVNH
jgi:hypothetical protein